LSSEAGLPIRHDTNEWAQLNLLRLWVAVSLVLHIHSHSLHVPGSGPDRVDIKFSGDFRDLTRFAPRQNRLFSGALSHLELRPMIQSQDNIMKNSYRSPLNVATTCRQLACALALCSLLCNHATVDAAVSHDKRDLTRLIEPQRSLQSADFTEFNKLFQNAVIDLPDNIEVTQEILFFDLVINLENLQCRDVSVGNIVIESALVAEGQLQVTIQVVDLSINCFSNYTYRWSQFDGSGGFEATSAGSDANVTLLFGTADGSSFSCAPPANATVASCGTNIVITDLNFNGGFVASILDAAVRLLASAVETQLEKRKCFHRQVARVSNSVIRPISRICDSAPFSCL
jgi:hypothetical protein